MSTDSTGTTRRTIIAGALIALPAIAVAGAIPSRNPDAAIEAAWAERQSAYAAYNDIPLNDAIGGEQTPEEERLWAIVDAAEKVICSTHATTTRGVSIQLWCALYHSVTGREDDEAITRGDLAALERADSRLDWNARLALAALRSLQAMGG